LEEFGFPPNFPTNANEDVEVEKVATPKENENNVDNKSKSKKVFFSFNHINELIIFLFE